VSIEVRIAESAPQLFVSSFGSGTALCDIFELSSYAYNIGFAGVISPCDGQLSHGHHRADG
jgi:hypothetical protein